jgi:hypothetical protein
MVYSSSKYHTLPPTLHAGLPKQSSFRQAMLLILYVDFPCELYAVLRYSYKKRGAFKHLSTLGPC